MLTLFVTKSAEIWYNYNMITKLGCYPERQLNLVTKNIDGVMVTLQEPAMNALINAADRCTVRIAIISSYRSCEEQKKLYDAYAACVAKYGHVYQCGLSAPPGDSYHNIALAIDITNYESRKVRVALKRNGWEWGASYGDKPHFTWKP